ncbi:MarR family transcriptional regulator [Halopenitus persicus]|uniref:MarR family transcriptional regulator n=1 Tax=Halopenitus persicus TaxID=1048396 RepID=UPI000BBA680F|nr:MarR family transcriptional regulator [Halopenitus persicus]
MQLDSVDSPGAKLVLLYLTEHGPCTPRQLADELDEPLLTILAVLNTLCRDELVERDDGRIRLTD